MAYKMEFEIKTPIKTAIPTLQNTFDSGLKKNLGWGGGVGEENELKLGGIGSTWWQLPTIMPKYALQEQTPF